MSAQRRAKHFRGLRFALECGHQATTSTSFWRLSEARVACLRGDAIRGGVWCDECRTRCQPTEFLGTARI